MKLAWKNIPISFKIFGVLLAIVVVFAASIILYIIPTLENKIVDERKENLKNMVSIAVGYCNSIYDDYEKGLVEKEEMKKRIYARVKSMTYGPENKDYLWINDMDRIMIMHPFNPDMEGKDQSNYADPTGKKIFTEFVNISQEKGGGFVDYLWQYKDDKDKIVPKISYVKLFKPLGYVIGTGVYIEDVKEAMRGFTIGIIVVMLVIAAIIGVIVFSITRSITKPIHRIIAFTSSLADGDFTGRIRDDDRGDEMGQLSSALNKATDGLEGLIISIVEAGRNLASAVSEISGGNQNLSQRTSEQASSLEEIASTIEETTATINQNAENATRASDLTNSGVTKSVEGNKIATEAVSSITDMNASSKKVADIIAVINEIAFQTNLLALNAAVEAARAGEQGRGFAVVAGEVRNLAQRSGNAAKEIETLIKDTVVKVEASTDLVNKTGHALVEIAESAKISAQIITEIAAASQEQKQGINQINTAIMEMDNMTQQNASLVEETASASEEMANQAQELIDMMQKFKTRADAESGPEWKGRGIRPSAPAPVRHEPARQKTTDRGNGKRPAIGTIPVPQPADNTRMKDILKQEGFEEF